MKDICDAVTAYFDGALTQEEATEFCEHLTSCAPCQDSLHQLVQLCYIEICARQSKPTIHAKETHRRSLPRRAYYSIFSAAAAMSVAAMLLFFGKIGNRSIDMRLLTKNTINRPFETRFAYRDLALYRPYSPYAGTASHFSEPNNFIALKKLAALEDASDWHGLGAAYLWNGEKERAAACLDRAGNDPDSENDRAVLMLARSDISGALNRLDPLIAQMPRHLQAHWNRAVALHQHGLDLAAADEFSFISAANEAGWAQEASAYAERLRRQTFTQRTNWLRMSAAGKELVRHGKRVPDDLVNSYPDETRLHFYDAVRSALSVEQLSALSPMANQLDKHFGGTHLQNYISQVISQPFEVRAPLAASYRKLATDIQPPSAQQVDELLGALSKGKQPDILIGALLLTGRVFNNLSNYLLMISESGDPWLLMLGEQMRATAEMAQDQYLDAETHLLSVIKVCDESRLRYRCAYAHFKLGDLYKQLNRTVEAKLHATVAREMASSIGAWDLETSTLGLMGDIAFFENDYSLTNAFFREVLLRNELDGGDCRWTKFLHEHLAMVDLFNYRFDSARQVLLDAGKCGETHSILGFFVEVDLSRVRKPIAPVVDIQRRVEKHLGGINQAGLKSAWRDFLLGRLLAAEDPTASQALLMNAISTAQARPPQDADAAKVRAYSYQTLVADAGRRGDFETTLNLLAEELKVDHPAPCSVGLGQDGALLTVVARDGDGRVQGKQVQVNYELGRKAASLVPGEFYSGLGRCQQIDVLAEPPMQGLPAILPPEFAWSYRLAPKHGTLHQQPVRSLIVADVEPPAILRLQPLAPWHFEDGQREHETLLRGARATPTEVLKAMADATEIIIHAHGLVNLGLSDSSMLILSKGTSGDYALTARQVQQSRLQGAPIVILSACHAAKPSPFLYAPWSLPAAFMGAGAAAVVAATIAIPSADASLFFAALRQRLRRGEAASMALRDERMVWLRKDPESWVKNVLLFN